MFKEALLHLEIACLQAEIKQLTEENAQLNESLSNLQSYYQEYVAGELSRRDDFLNVALKILISNGSITDNRTPTLTD